MRPHRRTSARSSRALVRSRGRRIGPCSWRGRPVRARELEGGSGCPRPWPWTRPKTQEHPRVQRMIGIGCIAPIQTSNRFQVSTASERRSMASESVKSQSDHFRASDHSSPAMTIRLSCTLYVAWKIVQLGIQSCTPIWPASSRSAQLAAFRRPLKPGRRTPGSCFLPGCIRGRAANVSARASTRVIVAGPLAAAGRRTPGHGPNFLFAPSPLSFRVRSEGEGGWLPLAPFAPRRVRRRLPRVPRALAARPPRGRRPGQGPRQAQGH